MKTLFKSGTLVDYAGVTREFTIAAVITNVDCVPMELDDIARLIESYENDCEDCAIQASHLPCEKAVYFGASIACPDDMVKTNSELAEKIAVGRALKPRSRMGEILMSNNLFYSLPYVQICLDRAVTVFSRDPEQFIAGYAGAKAKFEKKNKK